MSLNRAILIGHLGRDPELRTTQSGKTVANFTLATNENRRDTDGKRIDKTEWHRIVAWEKQAELASEYLTKGREVCIEGRLQTREWEDKNGGGTRRTTEIVASRITFLSGGRREEEQVAA